MENCECVAFVWYIVYLGIRRTCRFSVDMPMIAPRTNTCYVDWVNTQNGMTTVLLIMYLYRTYSNRITIEDAKHLERAGGK